MKRRVILDTGPLVALLNVRDNYHDWVKTEFAQVEPPLLSCETVFSEACFLLRMAEEYGQAAVMTLDNDLHTYRKHGRQVVPTITPGIVS